MINVLIYMNDKEQAEELARELVNEKLGASASVNVDNNYFELIDEKVRKIEHVVITLQTKALLFSVLTEFVEKRLQLEVPIYALPLISANQFFDQFIRNNTRKV
ncbi:MAG: divalent cation tolerance protein CutA [Reichenbachiella sp.]|uniref:divalent cation tolerance protein CutA n=1 Tax=Reichenbachiella sp. TaxID=2184521 RepID=UPI003264A078